jgi:4'-phosphopantetheinyl transferase
MDDLLDIAQRFFAESEVRAIEQAPLDARSLLFFQIWTLKESFVKATGEGLGRPLDQFAVLMGPEEPSIELIGTSESAHNWKLQSFCPAPGYVGGVAVQGGPIQMRWYAFEHEAMDEGE